MGQKADGPWRRRRLSLLMAVLVCALLAASGPFGAARGPKRAPVRGAKVLAWRGHRRVSGVVRPAVHRPVVRQAVRLVTTPFPVHVMVDPTLAAGSRILMDAGAPGLVREDVVIRSAEGRRAETTVLASQVVRPPVPETVAEGTGSGPPYLGHVERVLTVVATAYWPDPSWSSGYTATGLKAGYGVVAVDPSVIPLWSRLYIPGYGLAIAGDVGAAIRGLRIDLGYNTEWQALDFGVRTIQVYVLGPGL